MDELRKLCKKFTELSESDITVLDQVSVNLSRISELTGSDTFVDALTKNKKDAIVLAWAKPPEYSLYSASVVGQLAYHYNEPAVYHTLKTGEINRDFRGISQEGVPIAQTVVPIKNKDQKTIGVLIMERNISKELEQEEKVGLLSYTADKLSSTLMSLSVNEKNFEAWIGNGIFILNKHGKITYANRNASEIFIQITGREALGSSFLILFANCFSVADVLEHLKNPVEIYKEDRCYRFQSYPLIDEGKLSGCAVSTQDLTDLKKKEQKLNTQSIIIREIHHRVKNNLQNIAAVLRLQMRRSKSDTVKTEFAASINRIMSIALVHEVFAAQDWDTTELKEFCKRILDLVLESLEVNSGKIHTKVEGVSVNVSSSQAIPLALIISELITNSLKHGISDEGGHIYIYFSEKNGMINLIVSDSGEKLKEQPFFVQKKGLGMQIIESLVQNELEGFFRLERKDANTCAMVCFPKNIADKY